MDGQRVASVFSLVAGGKMLLYNSGYDPAYAYYSVGLLLKAFLIKKALKEGLQVYDFLRGEERYKYDLGARPLLLYQLVLSLNA